MVDHINEEPLGGVHRHAVETGENVKSTLIGQLDSITKLDTETLLGRRYKRLMAFGALEQ